MNSHFKTITCISFLVTGIQPGYGWESHQSHFMDAGAEASIDEALAGAYGQMADLRKKQGSIQDENTPVTHDRYEFNCNGTHLTVGGTTITPGSDTPDEVHSTTVVLGNVIAMNLCQ